jgi:DNA polymerase III delta prime subunit
MPSYVVQSQNVRNLVTGWEQLAHNHNAAQAQFRYEETLFAHLEEARFRRIQWFYYNDNDNGVTIRLYDSDFGVAYPNDFVEGNCVVLRGRHLGPAGGPLKGAMRALFNTRRPPHDLGADFQTRIDYFERLNNGVNPPPNGGDWLPPNVPPDNFQQLVEMLPQFRQVILYGPPGTGKTRLAKQAAYKMLKQEDPPPNDEDVERALAQLQKERRFDLVVFHPSYEYEQFVGGIAPAAAAGDKGLHYDVKPGVFLDLCRQASKDRPVVLIIDEINRGNLPKLLGELVYALEYRGENNPVRLPFEYSFEGAAKSNILCVPKNLYIIATMNSSDRSIGHIDAAVRRRFPQVLVGPDSAAIRGNWVAARDPDRGERLGALMKDLNAKLKEGELGKEIGVGHSYFLCDPELREPNGNPDLCKQIRRKWRYQVLPLLEEYKHLTELTADTIQQYSDRFEEICPEIPQPQIPQPPAGMEDEDEDIEDEDDELLA